MYITDWELRKLKNLVCFSKGSGYSKKDLVYEGNPIILYGNLYTNYSTIINDVRTYTNKKSSSIISTGRDVIVPASGETPEDIARASFVEVPGIIYGGDLNVLTVDTNILYPSYLAFLLSNGKIKTRLSRLAQGKSIVHLHNSDLEKISFLLPTYHEQKRISNILLNLEESITLQQQQLDLYTKLKKGLLQKLFPKDGEKVPEIRFADFTGNWEQCKLSQVIESIHKGTNLLGKESNDGIPLIKMGNIQRGYYDLSKLQYLDSKDNVESKSIIHYGDFLINTRNTLELVGKGATWFGKSNEYAFNSNISLITFSEINTIFFNYLYNTQYSIYKINSISVGTTSVAAIYPKDLCTISFIIPILQEQESIGKFLKKLDKLITLQQDKIKKVNLLKKYLLQKLFI